ncbi:hypothetical protein [Nocardioides solisilvae]|uniref:hypothetical protein n=1 Tax=Nocardioides solisilvae TaxID=1542435 RepID=UPI000D74465D|nr:hypothetical protein [Nocardioides solisilvae]
MTQPAPTASYAQTYRILTGSLLGAPVLIGLVLLFVGGTDPGEEGSWLTATPDPLFAGVLVVGGAALFALLPVMGYRLQPLEPGTEPEAARRAAQGRFQAASMLRFALAEAPVLVGIALAFVDGTYLLFLLGAVIGLALMVLHVWPSRRVVERSAEPLEARGVDSGLRAEFGYAGHP